MPLHYSMVQNRKALNPNSLSASRDEMEDFKVLYEAAGLLFSSLDKNLLLKKIVSLAKRVLSADYCSIVLTNEDGELITSIEDFEDILPLELRARPDGVTRQVLRTKMPIMINDTHDHICETNPLLINRGIRSFVATPLIVDGRSKGVLFAHSKEPYAFEGRFTVLNSFATFAAIALKNAMLMEEIRKQAVRDPLTNAFNYRYFHERLGEEIQRAKRNSTIFSLILFDFDNFKTLNDVHGHTFGDEALKTIAASIFSVLRGGDIFARCGGDEFIILLPDTDRKRARIVAERLLYAIQNTRLPSQELSLTILTASIGVVTYPYDGTSSRELLNKVDEEMFKAKRMGGDRISVYASHSDKEESAENLDYEAPNHFIYALAHAIDRKANSPYHHSQLVSNFSTQIAKELKLSMEESFDVKRAALLHDIGKLAIPNAILQKSSVLREDEWQILKSHSLIGYEIIQYIPEVRTLDKVIRAIHERYDGLGYPDGLIREEIPLAARIIAVSDVYCTLRSKRSYREEPFKDNEAISYIKSVSGKEFDPQVVDAFLEIIEKY